MLVALIISVLVVSACIYLHATVLRSMAKHILRNGTVIRRPLLKVLFALFLLHIVEVQIYAGVMLGMDQQGYGYLSGLTLDESSLYFDYAYFSMASYTTLGIGDIMPHGEVRLVAAIEALNGLVLIAWSASFTYLVMERYWSSEVEAGDAD